MGARLSVSLTALADTRALAMRLAPLVAAGDVLALSGDLGVGKTTFAQYLLAALGAAGEVTSPTFTLVQAYDTPRFTAHHFDWYRLKTPEEVEEIGFDDALSGGIAIVEWPEKAAAYLPPQALWLRFVADDGSRRVEIDAPRTWEERLKDWCDADGR